jgi:hypothetical protein
MLGYADPKKISFKDDTKRKKNHTFPFIQAFKIKGEKKSRISDKSKRTPPMKLKSVHTEVATLASDLCQADRIRRNRIGEQARPPQDLIPSVEGAGCQRSTFGPRGPFMEVGGCARLYLLREQGYNVI